MSHSHQHHDDHGHDDPAQEGHAHGHSHPELDDEARAHTGRYVDDRGRTRKLLFAFVLTTVTLVVEALGGWISGSLALLADAGHMLVDALALLFAWLGAYYARRPADARRSFGYGRLEVLVGYTNALTQFLLVAWIVYEAVDRFFTPQPILSGTMLLVAVAGLVVNLLVLRTLGGHDHDDLNTAGARLHVLGDLLGSVGAVSAALVVRYFDWLWADPAISVFVSLLILYSAWRLMARSAHILLEGVPEGLEMGEIAGAVESDVPGVRDVHHVHVWQLAGGVRVATLHARIDSGLEPDTAILAVSRVLRQRFGIEHATVQLDGIGCNEPLCAPPKGTGSDGHHGHAH